MPKTVLSFYCDDTNPYVAPPEAFKIFLDFCKAEGVRGESSVIPAYSFPEQTLLSRASTQSQVEYIEQARRAYDCGIDTHFELFTHSGLYDFASDTMPEGVIHEGLWMYEPAVTQAEYERYFSNILSEGDRLGIHYTGVTWPGCGCPACSQRYSELHAAGIVDPNPNVWKALLSLLKQGRFRRKVAPVFLAGAVPQCAARAVIREGDYAVVDLPPTAEDWFGIWLNTTERLDPDYYISSDGNSGRIVEQVRAGDPYCLFYCHWQGFNPSNGVGWAAFTEVVARIKRYLGGEVEWLTPGEYAERWLSEQQA